MTYEEMLDYCVENHVVLTKDQLNSLKEQYNNSEAVDEGVIDALKTAGSAIKNSKKVAAVAGKAVSAGKHIANAGRAVGKGAKAVGKAVEAHPNLVAAGSAATAAAATMGAAAVGAKSKKDQAYNDAIGEYKAKKEIEKKEATKESSVVYDATLDFLVENGIQVTKKQLASLKEATSSKKPMTQREFISSENKKNRMSDLANTGIAAAGDIGGRIAATAMQVKAQEKANDPVYQAKRKREAARQMAKEDLKDARFEAKMQKKYAKLHK